MKEKSDSKTASDCSTDNLHGRGRSRHRLLAFNAGDRKRSRFAMDPIQGRCTRRWRFTLKRRNAGRSVAISRQQGLSSATGLTRGSNRLGKTAGIVGFQRPARREQQGNAAGGRCQSALTCGVGSESRRACNQFGGSLVRLRDRPNRRLKPKSVQCFVSKEEASSDAAVR